MLSPPPSAVLLVCCCAFLALFLLAGCTSNGIYHTVKPGQTLYQIAQTYRVDEARLTKVNRITDPRKLRAGQRLYIPGVSQAMKVPVTVAPASPGKPSYPPAPPAGSKTANRPSEASQTPASVSSQPPVKASKPSEPRRSGAASVKPVKGMFGWPVEGKILNSFGSRGDTAHKGIEISCKKGTPILAAAPGKVIYSGNAIRGYGNLIIIEHSDNYFTVYGYNQKNLAAVDEYVGKGDKIAESGEPPNGKSPRLHFEIRRGKQAVDPSFYLP